MYQNCLNFLEHPNNVIRKIFWLSVKVNAKTGLSFYNLEFFMKF